MGHRFFFALFAVVVGLQHVTTDPEPKPFLFFGFGGKTAPSRNPTTVTFRPPGGIHGHLHRPGTPHLHRPHPPIVSSGFRPSRPIVRPPVILPAAGLHGPY